VTRLERAQANAAHWREQAAQVERERRAMIWLLRVGIPAGIVVFLVFHGWIGFGIAAMSMLTYVMGMYMTTVRRAEFAQHMRDADADLVAAQRIFEQ
jgi:hypothetical protein